MLSGLNDLLEIAGCSFVVLYLADGFVVSWSYLFFGFFCSGRTEFETLEEVKRKARIARTFTRFDH